LPKALLLKILFISYIAASEQTSLVIVKKQSSQPISNNIVKGDCMLKKIFFVLLIVFFNQNIYAQLPDFTELVKENGPSVVNISSNQKTRPNNNPNGKRQQMPEGVPPEMEELFKHFFNNPEGDYDDGNNSQSSGSGFIISSDGYILTNHHVVKNADEVIVKLSDRRELTAKIIGSDSRTDVAVLKVEASNLPAVSIGSPEKLQVGEWVLAIGSPFGFEQSATAGIVSAKGRSLPGAGGNYIPFIQTDVAINPGNSGGPLFNMDGKVVGINSQIYSRTGGFMGLSFSIPMDVVMNVVEQIKSSGKASHGWLGVQIQDVTRELAESFGMKKPQGALVAKILPNSPAANSDIQIGDIITEFNGHTIEMSSELPPMVGMTPINENATLKIIRQGETKTIDVKVGLLPERDKGIVKTENTGKSGNQLGIKVTDISPDERESLQISKGGVLVQDVETGVARDAGIRRGDVILRIQNQLIANVKDFEKIVGKLQQGKTVAVLIQRDGNPAFLAIKIEK
jgi:serine protease Do